MSVDVSGFEKSIAQLKQEVTPFLEGLAEMLSYQYQAYAEENFNESAPSSPFGSGKKLNVRSGALTRSLVPGQPGNATKIQTSGGFLKMSIGTSVVYAKIHEYGGFVKSKGRMHKFLMARYMATKNLVYLYTSLKVKRDGGINMPARPFMAPAAERLKSSAPDFIERQLVQFLSRALK